MSRSRFYRGMGRKWGALMQAPGVAAPAGHTYGPEVVPTSSSGWTNNGGAFLAAGNRVFLGQSDAGDITQPVILSGGSTYHAIITVNSGTGDVRALVGGVAGPLLTNPAPGDYPCDIVVSSGNTGLRASGDSGNLNVTLSVKKQLT